MKEGLQVSRETMTEKDINLGQYLASGIPVWDPESYSEHYQASEMGFWVIIIFNNSF